MSRGHTFVMDLAKGWRLAHDGELQWVVQRASGSPRLNSGGWTPVKYYTNREVMVRRLKILCDPHPSIIKAIEAWPVRYSAWLKERS